MKTLIFTCTIVLSLLNINLSNAGLDWNKGILTNADNLDRNPSAVAYDPGGSVYVAGSEELSSGNKLIVVKKYSSNGTLLYTHTNSYIVPAGTVISDGVESISIDASGNVYVLGGQFGTSARKNDIVLIKYNSTLSLQWKKLIYNPAYPTANYAESACKMILDASGNIFISGTWYSAATSDDNQIFVRKYNSAGTEIFSTSIAESFIIVNDEATDMSLDNNSNVTIVANTTASGVKKMVLARVNVVGSTAWIKYLEPPTNYNFFEPQIEATPTGTFYISSVLWKGVSSNSYYSKIAIVKYTSTGIKDWEVYTPELNTYPNQATLRLDANNNIYTGYDYTGTSGYGPNKYSLFKYNSGGSMLWNVVSSETYSQYFTFETYSSTALFVSFYDPSTGDPKLKKVNASNGSTIWTESVTVSQPAGYTSAFADARAIAVNPSTSDLAYVGKIIGNTGAPTYATEARWNVRKYGATSPRLSANETTEANLTSKIIVEAFPNPTSDFINIRYSEYSIPKVISFYDVQGKLLKQISENINSENTIPVYDLPVGIILICSEFGNKNVFSKIVVQ